MGVWKADCPEAGISSREVLFGGADVMLAGDYPVDEIIRCEHKCGSGFMFGSADVMLAGDYPVDEIIRYEYSVGVDLCLAVPT